MKLRGIIAGLFLLFAVIGHAQAQDNYCPFTGSFNSSFNPVFPGCGNFVLDRLASKPVIARSITRQLTTYYSGPLINVERTSDSTFKDIYALNGVLNQGQLMAFCAATTCGVDIIYNQESLGSAGNAVQSTAANQPVIVASGALQMLNGRPAIAPVSTVSPGMTFTGAVATGNASLTINSVYEAQTGINGPVFVGAIGTNAGVGIGYNATYFDCFQYGSAQSNYIAGISQVVSTGTRSPTAIIVYVNGIAATPSAAPATLALAAGGQLFTDYSINNISYYQEDIEWPVVISANDQSILETDQGKFYNIAGVQ